MTHYQVIIGRSINSVDYGQNPKAYLDTFTDETISLNYNIADIVDLANKNSSYSKTIRFPNTKYNQQVFSDIWSLNMTTEYLTLNTYVFDPNVKTKAWILKDNVIQFEGNLQLTNIIFDYNLNSIVYECVVYSDNDGLYKDIGENYLSDLDLTRFDHSWNATNILASWQAPYGNGYYYPMIDYGVPLSMTRTFRVSDFLPAMYLRTIWDQIFAEAGYTYDSDFLTGDYFSHLIMPYSNKSVPSSITLGITPQKSVLSIAQTTTQSVAYLRKNNSTLNTQPYLARWIYLYTATPMKGDTTIFNPNNLYNFTQSFYTNPANERFAQKLQITYTIRSQVRYAGIPFQSPDWIPQQWGGDTGDIYIFAVRSDGAQGTFGTQASIFNLWDLSSSSQTGGATLGWKRFYFNGQIGYSIRGNAQGGQEFYDPTTKEYEYRGTITTDLLIDPNALKFNENVMIWASTRAEFNKPGEYSPGVQFGDLFDVTLKIVNMSFNVIYESSVAVEDSTILTSNILPNMKQKDFLTNVIRMFNLYIDVDKTQPKRFLIEPRDDYYVKYQKTQDWSEKLDLTKEISTQIASNLQNRSQILTYKDDKDYYNTEYTNLTNTVFGEYKYEFDNEFASGEKKIELIFSPTPTVKLPLSNAMFISSIYGFNNGNLTNLGGFNPRILYANTLGLTAGDTYNFWTNGYNIGTAATMSQYPYAGFADEPRNPNTSLNFGTIQPFITNYNETINNLYYTYWQNTFLELNSPQSRIIEAYFNLTPIDIGNFSFADLFYLTIDNVAGYYRVNKIIDYDPSKYESTKVQLIKAINYINTLPLFQESCNVTYNKCLIGSEITTFLDTINSYYGSLTQYVTFVSSTDPTTYYPNLISSNEIGIDSIVDYANEIPGMVSTYYPGATQCTLNFEVEMGEDATLAFVGTLNAIYEDNPSPYVVIYINYPCGATFGTWQEYDNTYFWDLNSYNDQYSFLDWWLANIPGSYGTASGESLAEGSYLKLGWDWVTACTQSNNTCDLTYEITLNSTQAQELVDSVNGAYQDYCKYLVFYTTYANAAWTYGITYSTATGSPPPTQNTNTINDIVSWANDNVFGMSASIDGENNVTFLWTEYSVLCSTPPVDYTFRICLSNDWGSPAQCCQLLAESPISQNCPCAVDCFGECLQLYIAESSVDYLPGGWTPDLFVSNPILGPTSGIVWEQGGLTYGVCQDICQCIPEQLCFVWTQAQDCPGGVASAQMYISDATGEQVEEVLWTTTDSCLCDGPALPKFGYLEQSTGFRSPMPLTNNAYVGVLNSSKDNFIAAPNNIVLGSNTSIFSPNNIVVGDNNGNIVGGYNFILGASISTADSSNRPAVLIGNNITNELEGTFVFGNNVSISQPVSATGSTISTPQATTNVFVVGSNLTLGGSQSLPPNTTYLGTENIIISQDGGFNTPFIISEAVNTNEIPSGQTIIKTYTGLTPVILPSTTYYVFPFTEGTTPNANGVNIISWDDIRDFSIVQIEFNIRVELFGPQAFGDPVAAYSNKGAWVKLPNVSGLPDFSLIGTDAPFFVDANTPLITIDIPNTIYDIPLGIAQPSIEIANANATDSFVCYYDITIKYQYSPGGYYH